MVLTGTGAAQRRVSEEVRQRVLRAIEVTGYAANPFAQRLAGGRTSIIGVYTYESVFPHDSSDFYHPFLEGVENEAEHTGVDLLMFTSLSGASVGPGSGRRLLASGGLGRLRVADGCVLLGRHSYAEDLAELLRQDFPFAMIGRREAPGGRVPYAGAAYDEATEQVVQHLLTLGHRRIALVNEYVGHESIEDRARGYRRAMSEAGLQPITFDEPDLSSTELLDVLRSSGISAAAVSSDLAAPLRQAALARGLTVPGDLSIARLGDPEHPETETIDWTGFIIPRREMGAEALRVVLRQLTPLQGEQLQVQIPCTVTPGSTAGPYEPAGQPSAHQPPADRPDTSGKA